MSKTIVRITMTLDGYVAGPSQSLEHPMGVGGQAMHTWAFQLAAWREKAGMAGGVENASSAIVREMFENVGAVIMGRNMFGGGPGPWQEDWKGWWGDNPPYHMPVFVLTHHQRDPLAMEGDTTFHFVTDGIESALRQAKRAAGSKDVMVMGGANAVQQFLAAGLVDEVNISIAPLLLGGGERLLDNLGSPPPRFEQVRVVEGPGVVHVRYRVVH